MALQILTFKKKIYTAEITASPSYRDFLPGLPHSPSLILSLSLSLSLTLSLSLCLSLSLYLSLFPIPSLSIFPYTCALNVELSFHGYVTLYELSVTSIYSLPFLSLPFPPS